MKDRKYNRAVRHRQRCLTASEYFFLYMNRTVGIICIAALWSCAAARKKTENRKLEMEELIVTDNVIKDSMNMKSLGEMWKHEELKAVMDFCITELSFCEDSAGRGKEPKTEKRTSGRIVLDRTKTGGDKLESETVRNIHEEKKTKSAREEKTDIWHETKSDHLTLKGVLMAIGGAFAVCWICWRIIKRKR